jgi:tetratricopeptide (TPR) repeat protein
MFEYLEYSRVVLADLTGASANVFLLLAVRYRARESGTVVIRQADSPMPFDINETKAFPYEPFPMDAAAESRRLIIEVLEGSLKVNRIDSPVRLALRAQQAAAEPLLRDAEEALRNGDRATAIVKLTEAVKGDSGNALSHVKLGILLRDQGELDDAHRHFMQAIAIDPNFGEAHREKGVIESLWCRKSKSPDMAKSSEAALERAIELNPRDFDALASLGGLFRRLGENARALECYEKSASVSNGHPYPLLNAIRLRAIVQGALTIETTVERQLRRCAKQRKKQVDADFDLPWSVFDLAAINLYLGDSDQFQSLVEVGLDNCDHRWQAETFRDGLKALLDTGIRLPGLSEGVEILEAAIPGIPD